MNNISLGNKEVIHFVGIGGIGMSGLALIMKGKGFKVQGSDIANNKNIERLRKEKIKVFIGHKKQNIEKGTILVVSSAIKKNNPELLAAKKKQLPIYKRGEMLANIVSLTKNIVVVGSHGKTTTTSLIASIFQETKIDPTIINGGVINSINNSAKLGKSDWSILEADESDGSFVFMPSTYSIITGQEASQAPQVVQDQMVSSSMTPPSRGISVLEELLRLSRRSTVNCWGDRGFSVAHAGQARSQRPHCVQVCRSSICFQLRPSELVTPKVSSSSKLIRFKLFPESKLEKNTFGIDVKIWKCLLRGKRIKNIRIDEI